MVYQNIHPALSGHVFERSGCPIHYWLAGQNGAPAGTHSERPLVVLMHGATMDHRMFNAQVDALVDTYDVLVWDARGHGKSRPIGSEFSMATCAGDMLALLDELHVERAVVGGQSMGGYIAQHVYAFAPERVEALIIIGATPITKGYSRLEIRALKASLRVFSMWPYNHLTKTIARATARMSGARAYALDACRQVTRSDFLRIWKAVTLAVDGTGHPDLSFDVPLLLMHGQYDRHGTIRRDMASWAAADPAATYEIIPGAGHNANQDNADYTNEVLLRFLRTTSRSRM